MARPRRQGGPRYSKSDVREVDIHTRNLDLPSDASILSSDERDRAARFRFDRHRNHYIAARSALRQILAEYLGIAPQSIEFTVNEYGKPQLDGPHFNVSHSAGLAVYAVSRTRQVGIDVERVDPQFAAGQIPEHFFSPVEVASLRALPEHLQLQAFFNCWTRKEAYVKARGLGLSLPLASFDVTLDPGEPARFLRGADGWEIEAFSPAAGYAAAVVASLPSIV